MGGLAGLDPFPDRCLSDSEGRTAETSTVSDGLASTRNRRTRKTRGSDIGWLYSFGVRTKVLLGLVEVATAQASVLSVMAILQQLRRPSAIPEEPNPVLTPN
jgi:hypothetical protein